MWIDKWINGCIFPTIQYSKHPVNNINNNNENNININNNEPNIFVFVLYCFSLADPSFYSYAHPNMPSYPTKLRNNNNCHHHKYEWQTTTTLNTNVTKMTFNLFI